MSGDAGLWHCITGYLEAGISPGRQALMELNEETGLTPTELFSIREHEMLGLTDHEGLLWQVHTFSAETTQRRLTLNWEHETYRWVRPWAVSRFEGQVPWLTEVIGATRRGR